MKISFACPYCGKKLSAPTTSAGRDKTCPNCRARVTVPTSEDAARAAKAHKVEMRTAEDHPLLLMPKATKHHDLIDMTAMVDIVFFLLIFFLVTSLAQIEAVIDLPSPQASASAPEAMQATPDYANDPDFVIVTIDADDAVWVEDEEALSEQDLRAKLRAARQENDVSGLLINGAADASHGKFVMVLDAGADAGMTELLFSVPQSEEETGG